jgi:parallel beta-helix repeat protein
MVGEYEMSRNHVYSLVSVFVIMGVLGMAITVQRVKATYPIICIRDDGSVDPSYAPIQRDEDIYTLTDDIISEYNGISIERSNIVLDGASHKIQGTVVGPTVGIFLDSGRVNVTVRNVEITDFENGILLYNSSSNCVVGNNITENARFGIQFSQSSGNSIVGNNIIGNNVSGIYLDSPNNLIYHNNFIDNTAQVSMAMAGANVWDDGYPSGGNYWSNYTGVDSNHDGIGDTAHIIDENNTDNYPLMGMFSDFKATSEHHVQTICNSTIADFQFNGTAISFNISGGNGTAGSCRICIPTALMNATYKVFVNATEVSCNLLPCSNSTHSYLYFNYTHSTQEVIIIPEFPSILILPLFMISTLLAVIVYRRKYAGHHSD